MTDSVETTQETDADEETSTWEERPASAGRVFEDDGGRRLEVRPQTGDEWAAELYHRYGATRVVVAETEDEVLSKLVERGTLPASLY